jgi:hypothetical protein
MVELKRSLFEVSFSIMMETIAQPNAGEETDMSPEARKFKRSLDEIIPLLSAANKWDFLPVLRWFDVFGVRSKLMAAVNRRDGFIRQLIDAERRRLDDGTGGRHGMKQSMMAVLLTLQKTEPEMYTDKMILSLCMVSEIHCLILSPQRCYCHTSDWLIRFILPCFAEHVQRGD